MFGICDDNTEGETSISAEQSERGYNLRPKRRRLNNEDKESFPEYYTDGYFRRKSPIMCMPTEVLMNIFKYISYKEIGSNLRLVNRRFKTLSEDILNRYCSSLKDKLQQLRNVTYDSLDVSQGELEIRSVCKLLNILEFLIFYHSLIIATIWRHVYWTKCSNLCMYGGEVLDYYSNFIVDFQRDPQSHCLLHNTVYKIFPADIDRIIILVKRFCNYFEGKSELLANNVFVTGAKIVDILDCASCVTKDIILEKHSGNTYKTQMSYYFKNTWFVALDVPKTREREMSWEEEQKYMYMRLRRLVIAHSEMHMTQNQYQREISLLSNDTQQIIPRPHSSVYTGYGDGTGKFYFYGVMNDAAYRRKFKNEDDENDEFEDAMEEMDGTESSVVTTYNVPYLGVHVTINLKCPVELAPRRFIFATGKQIELKRAKAKGVFDMNVKIYCPGAEYPRLPQTHYFCIREKKS